LGFYFTYQQIPVIFIIGSGNDIKYQYWANMRDNWTLSSLHLQDVDSNELRYVDEEICNNFERQGGDNKKTNKRINNKRVSEECEQVKLEKKLLVDNNMHMF
ncbi:MAG: hypothetical protein HQK53_14295, partial [Oligoflexia bacterium]|nr:hypothetical protein [Oligoflexia bacterium]